MFIKINFPHGSAKEFPSGTTALDVIKSISLRLGKILPGDQVRQGGFCGEKMKLRVE
jgi:hypothetical protein